MNPGDTTGAALTTANQAALNEGRGMNPGDTRRPTPLTTAGTSTLNEGRGMNPGDTPTLEP